MFIKKLSIYLLLFIFCNINVSYAGENIIVGTDGQVRYEKNTQMISSEFSPDIIRHSKNALHEVTISDKQGQTRYLYFNNKGKVKKIVKSNIKSDFTAKQNKELQSYLQKTQKTIEGYESILRMVELKARVTGQTANIIDLSDGNYVVYYEGEPIAMEFEMDGSFSGIIKTNTISYQGRLILAFDEYVLGYNTHTGLGLRHVLFLDINKNDNYIEQLLYDENNELLFRQKNKEIYTSDKNTVKYMSKYYMNRMLSKLSGKPDLVINTNGYAFPADAGGMMFAVSSVPLFLTSGTLNKSIVNK